MATPEEKELEKNRERFKGYQLPKIQLDETGPTYYDVSPHPYFYNQPAFWQQAVFEDHPNGGVNNLVSNDIPTTADTPPVIDRSIDEGENTINNENNKSKGSLYSFLPLIT